MTMEMEQFRAFCVRLKQPRPPNLWNETIDLHIDKSGAIHGIPIFELNHVYMNTPDNIFPKACYGLDGF